jgi:hypothetical protein
VNHYPQTLGGIDWTKVVGQTAAAGAQFGLAKLFSGGGASGSRCMRGQVSGDQAMSACVPQVMAEFDKLQSQMHLLPPEQVVAIANEIAGIFSDNAYFDQGIGGRSREIREAAKASARQRADAIIAAVSRPGPNQMPSVTQTPQMGGGAQIDATTLAMLGLGGLFLVMYLRG